MTELYECASPEWLEMLCDVMVSTIERSGVDLTSVDYVWGEEFTNVPLRLNPGGRRSVGWTFTLRAGVISVSIEPPPASADKRIVADWEAVEPFVHHIYGDDPELDRAMQARVAELEAAGYVVRDVRRDEPPELQAALGRGEDPRRVHNLVVRRTAPRQS